MVGAFILESREIKHIRTQLHHRHSVDLGNKDAALGPHFPSLFILKGIRAMISYGKAWYKAIPLTAGHTHFGLTNFSSLITFGKVTANKNNPQQMQIDFTLPRIF